jgi:dephospho-CoA kinase
MLKVGISGIIGSGKSTVCHIFNLLGVQVYSADQEAKKLYARQDVKDMVEKAFGSSIFDSDGNILFKPLADIVFNNKNQLATINRIIHPLVKEEFQLWCQQFPDDHYVLYESALLFESGFYKDYDLSIVVMAPIELCISRIQERDNVSRQHVLARIDSQWAPERKAEQANLVIINDEKQLLIPQVLDTHHKIVNGNIDF